MSAFAGLKSRGRLDFLLSLVLSSSSFKDISVIRYLEPHLPSLLKSLFTADKTSTQLVVLQLLHKYKEEVNGDTLLKSGCGDVTSPFALLLSTQSAREIRTEAYKLLMYLLQSKKGSYVKLYLLRGLCDPDDEGMQAVGEENTSASSDNSTRIGIRRMVFNFFDSDLPKKPESRLMYLMSELYPEDEEYWICYAAYLMLILNKETREYDGLLFSQDLGKCVFKPLQLSESKSGDVSPFTNMFSLPATQSLLSSSSQKQMWRGTQSIDGTQRTGVRATQNVKWTQTQAFVGSRDADVEEMGPPSARPFKPQASYGGKHFVTQLTVSRSSDSQGYRHAPTPEKPRVVLYRAYREGELPDIQIARSDLVRPMAAFCLANKAFAGEILLTCFRETYLQLRNEGKQNDLLQLLVKMIAIPTAQSHLADVLLCLAMTVLKIEQSPRFDAASICHLGMKSLQLYGAIHLIEEQIIYSESAIGAQDHWISLSRLYAALGDEEMLMGVSTRNAFGNKSVLRALDSELQGDYINAIKEYSNVFESAPAEDREARIAGSEVWEERSWKCLKELGEWDQLYERIVSLSNEAIDCTHSESLFLDITRLSDGSRLRLLPSYLQCLIHSNDIERRTELDQFSMSLYQSTDICVKESRNILEANHTSDLALAFAIRKEWSAVQQMTKMCFDRFGKKWASTSTVAYQARKVRSISFRLLVAFNRVLYIGITAVSREYRGT